MNEVRHSASERVQRGVAKVISMISDTGHPAGDASDPLKEITMFKTISAALVAVSVLAAPALAAAPGKTAAIKAPVTKTVQAPVIKADTAKSKFLNANARMGHHHKHFRHHRHHKHMGALKTRTHAAPKFAVKHVTPSPKRG